MDTYSLAIINIETAMGIWTILQGPLVDVVLGLALAYTGLSFLGEYRKLFMSAPKTVM